MSGLLILFAVGYLRPIDYILQPAEGWYWLKNWRINLIDARDYWFAPRFDDGGYWEPSYEVWSRWTEFRLRLWWRIRYRNRDGE